MVTGAPLIAAVGLARRSLEPDSARAEAPRLLLRDVDLAVYPGDRLNLTGPSGAGKTVLLRALALLDPLDAGRVLWRGQPVAPAATPAFRARVMYLHQRAAVHDGNVLDNLRGPFALAVHRHQRFQQDEALALLRALGRDAGFLDTRSSSLSGGEAQIVALLRALLLAPDVLLLDEATSAMDPPTAEAAARLVGAWIDAAPSTRAVVWVGHDAALLGRHTTRTLLVAGGRVTDPLRAADKA